MTENRSRGECGFEVVELESSLIGEGEREFVGFFEKGSKVNNFFRVVEDEFSVEIGKAKESLQCLDGSRFGPIQNTLDLGLVHEEALRVDHKTEVIDRRRVEEALGCLSEQVVAPESIENLANVSDVVIQRPRIN